MPAATLEKPPVKLAKPGKAKVFLSRRSGLRLVVKRAQERKDWEGNVIEQIAGQHLLFEDGKLVVPARGEMRGENGEALDVAEVMAFLLGDEKRSRHHLLGDRQEGFWLHEEPAPAPSAEERDLLSQLGMDLDVKGLEAFIVEEEAGWDRPALLADARGSLERAERMVTERDEALAKARAEGEAAARPAASKPADGK